ncbi:hypothetical protein EDD18DRAFT_698727 [Armillaria luteobubalina]|uniref:Uncharacterized protein n=1 Tax=Armillaria luteobubalina TaxID=153913 RepID=A0AA39UJL0_9AGAR|nr:hypothetical protein EDD18DRAFT_698727 [Armillaria luteobubalina]
MYLYQSLCTSEIQVKSPPHRMSSFTVGSRVFFYDSNGRLAGGVVELTSVMGNGLQIVRIKCDNGKIITLPAAGVFRG